MIQRVVRKYTETDRMKVKSMYAIAKHSPQEIAELTKFPIATVQEWIRMSFGSRRSQKVEKPQPEPTRAMTREECLDEYFKLSTDPEFDDERLKWSTAARLASVSVAINTTDDEGDDE